MSVELKNWKELCKEKDERIKELEGKFDVIVERLETLRSKPMETVYDTILVGSIIEIVKDEVE